MQSMTFLEHLKELRTRLIRIVGILGLLTFTSYFFSKEIFNFLAEPLERILPSDHKFIYTDLTQGFFTHLKIAFLGGLVLSLPFMMWQIWHFISPALYEKEKRLGKIIIGMGPLLFLAGGAMAYYFVFPVAWKFFLSFEMPAIPNHQIPIQLEASIDQYLSLVIQMILAFGLSFQLPIVLTLGYKLGILGAESLRRYRRHGIVVIFIIAALVTPPDIVSQIALALPLMGLYEITLVLIWFLERPESRKG